MQKIKDLLLYRIVYWVLFMDIIIILLPFISAELFGAENSYFFLGFTLLWILLNIKNGKFTKDRYIIGETK